MHFISRTFYFKRSHLHALLLLAVQSTKNLDLVLYKHWLECLDSTLPPICHWKQIFMRAYHLTRNWQLGRYCVLPALRGHEDRINAMDCNGNISALFNNILVMFQSSYSFILPVWGSTFLIIRSRTGYRRTWRVTLHLGSESVQVFDEIECSQRTN